MKKKFKLGVIGAGFMSTAIINGAIDSSVINPTDIIVSDISDCALEKISKKGVATTLDAKFLADNCDFVLFAVKPQNLQSVLSVIANTTCNKFISIMAGVKKERIKSALSNVFVARCMPNTPCSIGFGAVGLDLSDFTNKDDIDFVTKLLSSFATVVCLDEDKMGIVTGVSGSSPAYFYLFLKGVIDAGVKRGLSYEDAKTLAVNTMIGAGQMVIKNQDKSIDELISAVCSKGGTTIEAVKVFEQENLSEITDKAIDACVKRSIELENL